MPRTPAVPRKRIEDFVHLAVPRVSRHVHRKLRLLCIRSDTSLRDLVIELITTHPRVVEVEDEWHEPKKKGT